MRPSEFQYHRAESLEHALALLREFGDEGRPIAGGQSLVPMMNLRLASPAHLVDINGLDLDAIGLAGDVLRIGALVRHERYQFERCLTERFPAFIDGVQAIGHPTIRRNGTLGGSLAHSDPTAELPLLVMLHDGIIVGASAAGERRIPATEFFEGPYMTMLAPDEMIVAVELPVPPAYSTGAFLEMAERRGDFAIAACGIVIEHEGGRIGRAAVACSGGGFVAMRASELEAALVGVDIARPDAAAAIADFTETLDPPSNHSASAEFRRALLGELLERALGVACARASEAA